LSSGDVLGAEHQRPRGLIVLETGALVAETMAPSGNRAVLGVLGPGDICGEHLLLNDSDRWPRRGRPHPMLPQYRALLPSRVRVIAEADLTTALAAERDAAAWLASRLAGRVADAQRALAMTLSLRLADRTAELLGGLARAWGSRSPSGVRIELPLTQDDLAAMLGATRESVNRTLRALHRSGRIARSGRSYVVRPVEEAFP
jgi:CRP-like cAMP-binding protein